MVRSVFIHLLFAAIFGVGAFAGGCGGDGAPAGADACAGAQCAPCDTGCGADCGDPCAPQRLAEAGASTALLMPDGRLAIAVYDDVKGALVVVLQRPGHAERVVHDVSGPSSSEAGRWACIALEAGGGLQVAWYDPAAGEVLWNRGDVAGFGSPSTVASVVASHLALEVDGDDRPHLAFRDDAARVVRYATRSGSRWSVLAVDGCAAESDCPAAYGEDSGQGLDLALVTAAGSGSLPRIAFYDALRGDLKLAGRDAFGRWSTVTLDGRADGVDTGDVGRFVSLALTPTRSLGVAYYDATHGALRYIAPNGGARVVDSGIIELEGGRVHRLDVGQFCTLDYDPQGSAHIVYVDASKPGIRHARVPGEGSAAIAELPIPAGAWPSFEVSGDRLLGAYGAFVPGAAPRTTLRLFDLPAGGGTP